MSESNIILLATYWNERGWIDPSLKQIKVIDPVEAIICDGCFDPSKKNRSTDGTRERIQEFVTDNPHYKMVSARRPNSITGVMSMFRGHTAQPLRSMLKPARWQSTWRAAQVVAYRRNQALTFQHMIDESEHWKPGRWFMTYDADQFYSDSMLDAFKSTSEEIEADLLTGDELTFFTSFDEYTSGYESRIYNNMPHRIKSDTSIRPTRDIILENGLLPTSVFESSYYVDNVNSKHVGEYFHYKIPLESTERFKRGYELGDREMPDIDSYDLQPYEGSHPTIIKKYLEQIGHR